MTGHKIKNTRKANVMTPEEVAAEMRKQLAHMVGPKKAERLLALKDRKKPGPKTDAPKWTDTTDVLIYLLLCDDTEGKLKPDTLAKRLAQLGIGSLDKRVAKKRDQQTWAEAIERSERGEGMLASRHILSSFDWSFGGRYI